MIPNTVYFIDENLMAAFACGFAVGCIFVLTMIAVYYILHTLF